MKKYCFIIFALFFCLQNVSAQIGYQVALLNTATGKPRAGETVNVTIEIGDKKSHLIWRETQTATSNDFGILSLSVGNENTFKNANWTNLPFFIAVWVNNVLIGRTQILSVPLAEAAKGGAPAFPINDLLGTWTDPDEWNGGTVTFNEDGTFSGVYGSVENGTTYSGIYTIHGNIVYTFKNYDSFYGKINDNSVSFFKEGRFIGGAYCTYSK